MKNKSVSYKIFNICNIIFMLLLCATMLYPYLNQLAISLNTGYDTARGGVTIFPREFTWENYQTVFNDPGVSKAAFISVSTTVIKIFLSLAVTFSAAYALTRRNLKGRSAITKYFVIPMYLSAGIIPTYILFRYLGLIDNYWVYIVPGLFSTYNMIIFRSFISGIPIDLEESALLDGANEIQIMFKVITPLAMPAIATVALWVAVGNWNDYTMTLYYVTRTDLYTLQYLMMKILKEGETLKQAALDAAMGADAIVKSKTTTDSVKAAMLIITTIPIICVYPFLQKYFVKGVTLGAVKG